MSRTHKDRAKTYKCKCSYCLKIRRKTALSKIHKLEIKDYENNI